MTKRATASRYLDVYHNTILAIGSIALFVFGLGFIFTGTFYYPLEMFNENKLLLFVCGWMWFDSLFRLIKATSFSFAKELKLEKTRWYRWLKRKLRKSLVATRYASKEEKKQWNKSLEASR